MNQHQDVLPPTLCDRLNLDKFIKSWMIELSLIVHFGSIDLYFFEVRIFWVEKYNIFYLKAYFAQVYPNWQPCGELAFQVIT